MTKTHGMEGTRIYNVWHGMKQRCDGTDKHSYNYYHKKGITYCPRWKYFINFYEDVKDTYADDLQLDRIDPNGNYEPSNCRWVTFTENMRNKENVIKIEYEGKIEPLISICERLNIPYARTRDRYKSGIRDLNLLFTNENLQVKKRTERPVTPCIVCGTLEGYADPKTGRPYRKKGMCNTCYQRNKNKKAEEL